MERTSSKDGGRFGRASKPHYQRVSSSQLSQLISQPAFVLLVMVEYSGVSYVLEVLIDSGALGNFIDQDTVQ